MAKTATAQVRASTALQLLAGNKRPAAIQADDDFEDELHADIEPSWEWIFDKDTTSTDEPRDIVGARLGRFVLRIGDAVTLKADRNDVWVALISRFIDSSDDDDDNDGDASDEAEAEGSSGKKALFTWLSSPREIRNPRHRRLDCLPNELYATANSDENPLEAILGRATLLTAEQFAEKFPTRTIPKGHPDNNRLFVCRRGANLRTNTYTEEFTWGKDVMQGADGAREVHELIDKVERETVKTRKRRAPPGRDTAHGLKDFVVDDNEDAPETPRKRRKHSDTPTPRKRAPGAGATPKRTPGSKFTTPTHKRIVEKKHLMFTPLGTRILSNDGDSLQQSPHQQARTHLHVASVPASLPCREEEFSTVYTHLDSAISEGLGSCIYISGTPGTGKTATVREVIAQLQASVEADELDDFDFCEINGMRLVDPHQAYAVLWEKMSGARVATGHALSLLNQEFSRPSPRRTPVVVLMDELDQLATRSQSVMYNFFQWPQLRYSRLIVLAVANTMDLPERMLSNKISSRLGLARIVFQGYTHSQLMRIVETRLANISAADVVVDNDAVQFAARKVAGVSGDARRCLDICRRAVEIAEQDVQDAQLEADTTADAADDAGVPEPDTPSKRNRHKDQSTKPLPTVQKQPQGRVTIATIQRAIRESTSSPIAAYLRSTSLASKLFLAALLARTRRSGVAESTLGDVRDEARRMARTSEVPAFADALLNEFVTATGAGTGLAEDGRLRKGMPRRGEQDDGDAVMRRAAARVLGLDTAVAQLVDAGVVTVEERRGERAARCRLLVGEEDVRGALRGDEEVKGMGFD